MEKIIVIVLILIVLSFVSFKLFYKPKSTSWKGEVKDKRTGEDNSFYITVIKDDNKIVEVKISKILWSNLERGDRVEKRLGDPYPRKI